MSLNGITLNFTWRTPDSNTVLFAGDFTVGEILRIGRLDIGFVGIEEDFITLSNNSASATSFDAASFNGFVFRDTYNMLPAIGGITILTNNISYDSSRTTFDSEKIAINVAGLGMSADTMLKFRLELTPTDIALSAASVEENASGAVIGALTVADLNDADTHTFDVSDARFEVVDGQLKLKDGVALDFETESAINVTITATDSFDLSYSEAMAINVTDVAVRIVGDNRDNKLQGTDDEEILRGRRGDDILLGKAGDDNLRSVRGNDRLVGGSGADTFVFSTGSDKDTITDFVTGIDHIDLSKWKAIGDLGDMKIHAGNHGDDLWITAGKDVLVIKDMHKGDLDAGDFVF